MSDGHDLALWSFPTRVVAGEGASAYTAREALRLGATRVLIVSDRGIEAAGLLDPIRETLELNQLTHTSALDISSNPLEAEVLGAAEAFTDFGADLVLGIGGGSVLDVAKLVRLAATHPPPLAQYDDSLGGSAKIVEPMPPMIAIPTTAGTGSEVGRSGVVTIEATNTKTVIFAPSLLPDVAILDPIMTKTMPPFMTAATGMDALAHSIEAYAAIGDHPMADAIALGGIRLCRTALGVATESPDDLGARADMLKAAMMGAVAFQKGLGACHSLAHPLSTEFGLHHGLANAICLPAVLDYNRTVIPNRIAEMARQLGVKDSDDNTLSFECAGAVRALRRSIGLPGDLRSQGIEDKDLPKLAALAYKDVCHQLNPRPCTEEDLLALYKASLDDG